MMLEELLSVLEERLVQHDNSRKEVQNQVHEICAKMLEEADALEGKFYEKIQGSFDKKEE